MGEKVQSVALIGLGSMGLGMALSLLRAGHTVTGVDVTEARRSAIEAAGGAFTLDAREAAKGADVVVSAVVNAAQTENVLTGKGGILEVMDEGAAIVSCATVPPAFARRMGAEVERHGIHYVDAPMSGGAARAEEGALSFMASGSPQAFDTAAPALDAMAQTLYRIGDEIGLGSSVKLVNQLLAGVHIAAACEAMTLGVKMGLDPDTLFEVISNSAGSSWMFQNRVPHILEGDYSPKSAVGIFTKDLGIVLDTARDEKFPVPVAGSALQMFLMTAAAGMQDDDDSSVARLYARIAGITLPSSKSSNA